MNAEILCVGTELLLGDIVNTNAAYIARALAQCGIGCYYQSVVGDNPERLKTSLELALSRADVVITTGGLGPTYDDLTKETVAAYFGLEMERHEPTLRRIREIFARIGCEATANNEKQAYMPAGAVIFDNDCGTAPGLAVEGDGKTVILMPGPPREMTAMFEAKVRPYLLARSDRTLVSHTIHLYGIGESALENELRDYMRTRDNPTIAPYAKEGEVQLRVTAAAATAAEAEAMIRPVLAEIGGRYADYIYGVDAGSLQQALVAALREKGLTLATAESCTGGLIGGRITEVSGASAVYGGGVVTYSNEMKQQLIGVPAETLAAYGAVSEQTALAMARGVRRVCGADIGVSVTGIAGPDGGTPEKPVGLVYIGVSGDGMERVLERRLSRGYADERAGIRHAASSAALHLALRAVRGA